MEIPLSNTSALVSLEELLRKLMDPSVAIGDVDAGHAVVPERWGSREFVRLPRADTMLWEVEQGGLVYHDPEQGPRPIDPGSGLVVPGTRGGRFTIADESPEVRVHFLRFRLGAEQPLLLSGPARIGTRQGGGLSDLVELHRTCAALDTELGWLRLRGALVAWVGGVCANPTGPSLRTGGLSPPVRRACISFIHAHLAEGFRLADLANACGLNPVYFSGRFTSTFGRSVRAYTTAARVALARSLLLDTSLPLTRIAGMAGFSDVYQFCRMFKAAVGVPPGRWRRMQGSV